MTCLFAAEISVGYRRNAQILISKHNTPFVSYNRIQNTRKAEGRVSMDYLAEMIAAVDRAVWGSVMLVLLVGTGVVLTVRCRFLTWRNLPWAIRVTLSRESREKGRGNGDVSPFSALMTALAATIGTGNIVGVATAMAAGGPGALVWMWVSAFFGLSSKFAECMLAVKYREKNERGEMCGGPMYTMKNAWRTGGAGRKQSTRTDALGKGSGRSCKTARNRLPGGPGFGAALGGCFAFFAVLASFGIGNMTQSNSIAASLHAAFGFPAEMVGVVLTVLSFVVIMGGIRSIARVSSLVVPIMAVFYMICGLLVIIGNLSNLSAGLLMIFKMAFSPRAVGGALGGNLTASVFTALRYGVARGIFSNEAGMGSAAITAAAASADHPVRQGYINMTGTFWDTLVVCTITGLVIACSGVLGQVNPATGAAYEGAALTIAAFSTVLGRTGGALVTIGIVLFAFSTILGWEYQGEKAFEYLAGSRRYNRIYRLLFSLAVYIGATQTLELVWGFSDIANALMALPNLISLLFLGKEVGRDAREYQRVIEREEKIKKQKQSKIYY